MRSCEAFDSNTYKKSPTKGFLYHVWKLFQNRMMIILLKYDGAQDGHKAIGNEASDWAYSKSVVILDIIWNFAFVVVAVMVMVRSHYEYLHDAPLRVSIFGYALHCFLHIVCLHIEYRGRQQLQRSDCCFNLENEGIESGSYKNLSTAAGEDSKKLDEDDKKSR
ncbi:hypothetical protein FEM48_ZijujUnG0016900 [Ziziphus jujuba var. spinosa]|uniref:RING-type E3 ubiquitin transferase n=1 Tax=Ziziphus jujuba var. spinosa TaxID=714518 RepID=A0A978U9V1_ZIZJJ|nr:hypothetical protein FEM48_ZijujUnG0016900 [Ziziphus jujuba var. spinosa]